MMMQLVIHFFLLNSCLLIYLLFFTTCLLIEIANEFIDLHCLTAIVCGLVNFHQTATSATEEVYVVNPVQLLIYKYS